ncbi:MAG: asparaginase [Acidimicrobiaceae bacterium]|nr:asparaginase [Ilumatobacter sp.]MCB9380897.1 asparaginase [Acidimicrobiaceae bacterium]MCO5329824.1 asparaginase [Ilumatobacteraceae bacterium]
MTTPDAFVPVAITSRSGLDESVHFGAVVGLAADGSVAFAAGDPATAVYPRSSNKPMQAVAMVRAGLALPAELLALVCASHDGTPMHTAAALRILHGAGLVEADLANTPSFPLDEHSAHEVLRHGGGRTSLQMNCSGKHAGMLAACVANGWPHDPGYLEVDHPLQQSITAAIDELTGEPNTNIGVDGCGAPAHAFSLAGLARAFRAIATGAAGPAGDAVYAAMTGHPEMVGGATRDVTVFMRHVPGLMAKDGADGVFAAALPDGRAVALKVADGGDRARPPLMAAALAALGVDVAEVAPLVAQPIMGHGRPVGEVRAIAP